MEVLVALTLFIFMTIFFLYARMLSYRIKLDNLIKDETVKIATAQLEEMRTTDSDNLNAYACPEDCNSYINSENPQCTDKRQIRNRTVTFGKQINIEDHGDIKVVSITVCSDYKDFREEPIKYSTVTVLGR